MLPYLLVYRKNSVSGMVCGDSLGTLSDDLGGCSSTCSTSAERGMLATNIDSECVILDTSHVSDTIQPLVNAGNDSFANSLMLLLYSIPQFVEELHVLKSNMPLADCLLKVIGGGSRIFLGHFSVLMYMKVLIKLDQTLFTACDYLFVLSSSARSKFRKYGGFYRNSRL